MRPKILIVDDDIPLAQTVESLLFRRGYAPTLAHTAEDGLQLALTQRPTLILLDVMVPQMGGWEVCRQIRKSLDTPIIFLTALGHTENIVQGLELGADDYLVKPFQEEEFLARIKANIRRTQSSTKQPDILSFSNGLLIIDIAARQVIKEEQEVGLTPHEFDLLAALAKNAGRVITTTDLVQQAWGSDYHDAGDNVKPYIHYLRKKIESDPASPRWIKTARGIGYRFVDD